MKKRDTVFVRNNGTEAMSSRFDGEDFSIEPGEYLEMEMDCATLVFGLGEIDKSRAIRRLGWAPMSDMYREALERLNAFSFHMSELELQGHSSAPVDVPAIDNHSDHQEPDVFRSLPPDLGKPKNALEKLGRLNAA